MTYKISITKHGDPGPFWTKIATTREDADRIVRKNQRLIDRHKLDHTITLEEIP